MIKQRRPSLSLSLSPSPAPSPQLDVPVACLLLPTLSASVVAFVCVLFFFVLFRFLRFLARLARARVTYLFLQDLLSCSERRHGGLLMSHLQSQLLITPFLLSLSSLSLSLSLLSLSLSLWKSSGKAPEKRERRERRERRETESLVTMKVHVLTEPGREAKDVQVSSGWSRWLLTTSLTCFQGWWWGGVFLLKN